nr:hypothetical protein [Zobellia laminariae]
MLLEFKEPISKILQSSNKLESHEDDVRKEIFNQSGRLINLLSEWDYLNHAKDIGEQKKSAIKLCPTLKVLMDGLILQAKKSKIQLDYSLDIKDVWVEIDILRFKLLFKYLFNDIVKYSTKGSRLKVIINNSENRITLNISSNSKVLVDNFFSMQHYSPYFKAANTLTKALDGHIKTNRDKGLTFF